jgi:hypothetical protein
MTRFQLCFQVIHPKYFFNSTLSRENEIFFLRIFFFKNAKMVLFTCNLKMRTTQQFSGVKLSHNNNDK